ncbi:MAG: SPOR domain-containing protein [Gemmatimonadales bacterium]
MRLPAEGGGAILLRGDSLTALDWSIESGIPKIARGLGTDLEEKIVYAVDTDGRLVGLDLFARRSRVYLAAARALVTTPEGVIFGLDSAGHALRFAGRSLTTFRASLDAGPTELVRAPGTQVAAVSSRSGIIQVIGDDGEARRIDAPPGRVTSTWYGDMIAVTTDSGVLFVDPRGKPDPTFHRVSGKLVTAVFSPSGHRLYAARAQGDIAVLAPTVRGSTSLIVSDAGTLPLGGRASAIRIDKSGRWLLAKPEKGDSVWLVDVVRHELAATINTRWADDLPLVTGGRTLVVRSGKDVVAYDVTGNAPVERARLSGAASDVFMVVPWAPRTAAPLSEPVAIATADSAPEPAEPDSIPSDPDVMPTLPSPTDSMPEVAVPPAGPTPVYLQVSSSQNSEWARAFADQLKQGGFPARVLDPAKQDEGFRVVVGPYRTREEADATGRRLGRPYFVITLGAGGT